MARKIWINASDSFILHTGEWDNPPKHFNVSLAAGHVVPMDDFIVSKDMPLPLETYEVIDPDMNKTSLPMPAPSSDKLIETTSGLTIESGDVAAKKIRISPETVSGTYQVAAKTKELIFDLPYLNGKVIKAKAKYFAKTFLTVNDWTQPEPLGHELELLPLSDLSNVQVDDWVSFEVKFLGKPFGCNMEGDLEYLLAKSNTYGGEAGGNLEGFFLGAYLLNGRARFRMPSAGQWMIVVFNIKDVGPGSVYKDFAGECNKIFYHSTVTFNVRA